MGYPIPKLTRSNQHKFFGDNVKHCDLFSYSDAFLLKDVGDLAKKHGYWIGYCKPGTQEYKMHGSQVCYAYEIERAAEEMEKNSWDTKALPEKWEEFRTKIGDLVLQFEAKKEQAAKIRDDLRSIVGEIGDIVDSFDDGVEGLEDALEQFKHALDDMSRYV